MEQYYNETTIQHLLDIELKISSRVMRFLITNDNDDSYIPQIKTNFVLCDCFNGDDFTLGSTWKKYFDDQNNKPVVFINTSSMFHQFKLKANKFGTEKAGSALWAQYFYENYRDKMWREQRTKFIFVVKEEDIDAMCKYVDAGFITELRTYYIQRTQIQNKNFQEQSESILSKKLTPPPKH